MMRYRKKNAGRKIYDPLKDWDGEAYWTDGVTPMRIVKREMEADLRVFDALQRKFRDELNEVGGVSEEFLEGNRPQTTGGF